MKFCITIVKHIENIAHHYITPLVINSLGGGHTHTHKQTHTHILMFCTGSTLRNQVLRPACAWFKNAFHKILEANLQRP